MEQLTEDMVYRPRRERNQSEHAFDIILQKSNTRQDMRCMVVCKRGDSKEAMRAELHKNFDFIIDKYFQYL